METLTCRWFAHSLADGPHNMAADEGLLEAAEVGVASFRLYGWSTPTLSLGYFQPARLRLDDPLLKQLPFVRRPSGGDTLVHHHELTYALALPAGPTWQGGEPWASRMHAILAQVLAELGVSVQACRPETAFSHEGPLCFRHFTPGDLLIGAAKVVGSAQRRRRGALLQHGSLLLAQSPFTPSLPGIREFTGKALALEEVIQAVGIALRQNTGWEMTPAHWMDSDLKRIDSLTREKYSSTAWNEKR